MLMWINKRLRDDRGFTLIELMVVVLIIAILIAIAIPTFLGARRRAQNRQAQSNLRNGLTSEKTYYADAQVYTDVDADLSAIESNLDWGNAEAAERGVVVQAVGDLDQSVVLRSLSKAGIMFCIGDVAQSGLTPLAGMPDEAGTYYAKVDTGTITVTTTCTGGWGPTTASW
jgi:type IV pilus assembly protein PilA